MTYQDREGHGCGLVHDGPLIAAAEYYASVGERTFWNWYQTLSRDDQRLVEHHMNRKV